MTFQNDGLKWPCGDGKETRKQRWNKRTVSPISLKKNFRATVKQKSEKVKDMIRL